MSFQENFEEVQDRLQQLKSQRAGIESQIEKYEYVLDNIVRKAGLPQIKQRLADQIRAHAGKKVESARKRGEMEIKFRAGDIHREMGLTNRYPAIASAIQAKKFSDFYRVQLMDERGPIAGSNRYLTFKILP